MILSVHQPQYLPWLGYFEKIAKSDCFVFLDCVQYKHREFQNRNQIRTPGGRLWLSVPVITKGNHQQLISEVLIDNSGSWQKKHWHSIVSAYGKAEYFDQHADFFQQVYLKTQWLRLTELNVFIIEYLLKQLEIKTPIQFESKIGTTKTSTERIIELCKKLNADTYLSGAGGKDYMDEARFSQENIKLQYQQYVHSIYVQQHMAEKKDFLPYMSIIDLLFNQGPASKNILIGGQT